MPYDPSSYTSSSGPPQPTRNWQFSDYESQVLGTISLPGSSSSLKVTGSHTEGKSSSRADRILRDILRASNIPYNPAQLRRNGQKQPWEKVATTNANISKAARDLREQGVSRENRGYLTEERHHDQQSDTYQEFNCLAAKKGYKHKLSYEDWCKLKQATAEKQQHVNKETKEQREKDAREKSEKNEKAFEDWMERRGRRKMEIINQTLTDDDMAAAAAAAAEKEDADLAAAAQHAGDPKPWRKYVKTEAQKEREEAHAVKMHLMEREEKEAKEAAAHGVFLEWLAEKMRLKKLRVKEMRREKAEQAIEDRKERNERWKKNVVVNCHGGEVPILLRKKGLNKNLS
jgi:hypothetical protein